MWSDRDTVDDCLGFSSYVASLAEVCLDEDIAPMTIGLFGSWGSGKTSLMRMLEQGVSDRGGDSVKTVWFNAWKYDGKDEVQSALINAILSRLQDDLTLGDEAKQLLARLKDSASVLKLAKVIAKSLFTMTPDIGGFLSSFSDQAERLAKTVEEFEKDFQEFLETLGVDRVVVFIDDLDRCQNEKVLETFETIKLFLNTPSATFVVGADNMRIEQAIREVVTKSRHEPETGGRHGRTLAEDYLEKIVQIPFRIPEQRTEDIGCYIGMLLLKKRLPLEGWKTLLSERPQLRASPNPPVTAFSSWLKDHADLVDEELSSSLDELNGVMPYVNIIAEGLRGNPRQIKRFLNILELRRGLARANALEIDIAVLIKILVLEYTWKSFFRDVAETFDPVSGKSELLVELTRVHAGEAEDNEESQMLSDALATSGLPEFVVSAPGLAEENLGPYLFLAQTALDARPRTALAPPDEMVRLLADRISASDRIRSSSATRQALRENESTVAAVVRELLRTIELADDIQGKVNAVRGLVDICKKSPQHYETAVSSLSRQSLEKQEPLAMTVGLLASAAVKGKTPGALELLREARKHSKFAHAVFKDQKKED